MDPPKVCLILFDHKAPILISRPVHKGIVLGTPLIQICYNGLSLQEQGIVLVPAVLYQGFQIVFGQISVAIIKNWRLRSLAAAADATGGSISQDVECVPTGSPHMGAKSNTGIVDNFVK